MSTPEEQHQPDISEVEPLPASADLTDDRQSVSDAVENVITLTSDQQKLQRLREAGEVSEHDFDVNELWNFIEADVPLKKADLLNRAVVLTHDDIEQMGGYIEVQWANGDIEPIGIERMNGPVLIIFPEELL